MAISTDIPLRLKIDETILDEEWQGHAEMAYAWAKKSAKANAEIERQKAALELTAADLDLAIRQNPGVYGLAKVTETSLKAAVVASPDYQRAKEKTIQAKHDADVIAAAVASLRDRKHALQGLVELHIAGYSAAPRQHTRPSRAAGVRPRGDGDETNEADGGS